MSPRDRGQTTGSPASRRAVVLTAVLSVVAAVVAVGALALVLSRGSDANACGTVVWNAIPETSALPAGWTMVSNRTFVDNLGTTLLGPTPSGATQAPAVFVSTSCYGNDGALAMRRSHEGALAAGATDVSFATLGDESFAVHSSSADNTTVYIRRGALVAEITAAAAVDQSTLDGLARIVDADMTRALSEGPAASHAPLASRAPTAGPTSGTIPSNPPAAPSAAPSQTPVAESHVSPDLEAVLPHVVGTTTFISQSILGTVALQTDAASQALIASLKKLGKTPADLEIAEAQDPSGSFKAYLFAYRVKGVTAAVLGQAVVDSLLVDTSSAPKRSQVSLAGHPTTKLTYATGSSVYLYQLRDVVVAIETPDESLASQVLALVK